MGVPFSITPTKLFFIHTGGKIADEERSVSTTAEMARSFES
jgi:hypothetical protein